MGRKKRRRRTGKGRTEGTETRTGQNIGETSTVTGAGIAASESTGSGTGEEKPVMASGVLEIMSDVRIDDTQLAAEADQVAQQFAQDQPAQPLNAPADAPAASEGPTPEQIEAGYKLIVYAVMDRGATVLAPAWAVTMDEKARFSDAMGKALALWFPDMAVPPKWLALLVVAGVGFEIIEARRDPETGKLKPLRNAKPKPSEQLAEKQAA